MTQQSKETKEYKVLRIDQLSRMSETRGIEQYYRVQIKTRGGVILDVDLDSKDFTEDKAKAILTKQAQNADKILGL